MGCKRNHGSQRNIQASQPYLQQLSLHHSSQGSSTGSCGPRKGSMGSEVREAEDLRHLQMGPRKAWRQAQDGGVQGGPQQLRLLRYEHRRSEHTSLPLQDRRQQQDYQDLPPAPPPAPPTGGMETSTWDLLCSCRPTVGLSIPGTSSRLLGLTSWGTPSPCTDATPS